MLRWRWLPLLAAIGAFAADRAGKALVPGWLAGAPPSHHFGPPTVRLLGNALRLTYVRNEGAVFGLLARAERGWRDAVLVVAGAGGLVLLAWALIRLPASRPRLRLGLALILGGATSNLLDRVRLGYVLDFIDAAVLGVRGPAFNPADLAIVAGLCLAWLGLGEPAVRLPVGEAEP